MRERKANMTNRIAAAIAVGCVAFVASATDYYWIGGESGEWAKYYNWSLTPGGGAASTYPSDYSVDQATIASDTVITLPGSNANVSNLFVNANVELKDGKIHAKTISGSGKLTMGPYATFYASEGSTVSVDVEIPTGGPVYVDTSASYAGFTFTAECALTGSGTIEFKGYRPSHPLYWDANSFSGMVVVVKDSVTRNNTTICSTSATHGGMAWGVANSGAEDTGFITQEGTYKFGSMTGTVYMVNNKSGKYAYVKNVIMEIGALNRDDVLGGRISRNAGRANDGAYIRKVGTGVLSSSVAGVNGYYIKEGVLNIASDDGLSVKDDYSNPGTDIVFEGGILRLAAGVTKDASAYIALGESSSPVVFDDEGRDHVWNTALGSSLTGGLTKKGSGTLTLARMPAYAGTTTIEGGVLKVPQGMAIGKLSCAGGKLTVPLTGTEDETIVLTIDELAAGTTVADVEAAVAVAGATMSVEPGVSGYVVKATRAPQTYTWTGAVDDDWAKTGNWMVVESVPVTAPHAADSVLFPTSATPWTVSLSADAVASNIVFDAATEITGGSFKITVVEVSGTGTVTAKGLTLVAPVNTYLYIRAPLDIPEGFVFETATSTQYNHVNLYSKVTGSGEWKMNQSNTNQRGGVQFRGDQGADMSEFAGKLTVINKGSATRDQTGVYGSIASSSNAVWTVYGYDKSGDDGSSFVKDANTTYYFGALNGYVCASGDQTKHNNNIWEIGAREDTNSVVSGNFFCNSYPNLVGDRSDTIRKVGAGSTLTFSGSRVRAYEVNAGVLKLGADASLLTTWEKNGGGSYVPSITFNGGTLKLSNAVTLDVSTNISKVASTAAVAFDDEGINRTWEVAIPGTGGLTKKGAGTLTLAAIPQYSGVTKVEAGELIVPEGTVLDVCFSSGTLTGAAVSNVTFDAGYEFTVGSDAAIVATGTADISNLVIYITDPAATAAYPVLDATGGLSGTPTLAFPPETSDKLKERWLLRVGGKSVSVGTRMGGIFVLR